MVKVHLLALQYARTIAVLGRGRESAKHRSDQNRSYARWNTLPKKYFRCPVLCTPHRVTTSTIHQNVVWRLPDNHDSPDKSANHIPGYGPCVHSQPKPRLAVKDMSSERVRMNQ